MDKKMSEEIGLNCGLNGFMCLCIHGGSQIIQRGRMIRQGI